MMPPSLGIPDGGSLLLPRAHSARARNAARREQNSGCERLLCVSFGSRTALRGGYQVFDLNY